MVAVIRAIEERSKGAAQPALCSMSRIQIARHIDLHSEGDRRGAARLPSHHGHMLRGNGVWRRTPGTNLILRLRDPIFSIVREIQRMSPWRARSGTPQAESAHVTRYRRAFFPLADAQSL